MALAYCNRINGFISPYWEVYNSSEIALCRLPELPLQHLERNRAVPHLFILELQPLQVGGWVEMVQRRKKPSSSLGCTMGYVTGKFGYGVLYRLLVLLVQRGKKPSSSLSSSMHDELTTVYVVWDQQTAAAHIDLPREEIC